jgi:hypothetical protein
MRKLLALLLSVFMVLGFGVAAQSTGAKSKVYQQTLATFNGDATSLTEAQRAQVRKAVQENPDAEKFVCTGIRFQSQPMSVNIMVRKRAKAACDYAKQLNPSLSTWFQNKPTQARSFAGKVLLTVKSRDSAGEQPYSDAAAIKDRWSSWDGSGTVWITADAITPTSPSDFLGITYTGIRNRETYDRRVNNWIREDSRVFTASYKCGRATIDVVVNPEFTQAEALEEASRAARVVGQLPIGLRTNVDELWIHDGWELAGGGNNSILVYSDYFNTELASIEEVFVHEAAHTSLDYNFDGAVDQAAWAAAVASDGRFISDYARDYPDREDIAESYGAFLIWAMNRDYGLFSESAAGIEARIPARLAYFKSLGPDYGPLPASCGQ